MNDFDAELKRNDLAEIDELLRDAIANGPSLEIDPARLLADARRSIESDPELAELQRRLDDVRYGKEEVLIEVLPRFVRLPFVPDGENTSPIKKGGILNRVARLTALRTVGMFKADEATVDYHVGVVEEALFDLYTWYENQQREAIRELAFEDDDYVEKIACIHGGVARARRAINWVFAALYPYINAKFGIPLPSIPNRLDERAEENHQKQADREPYTGHKAPPKEECHLQRIKWALSGRVEDATVERIRLVRQANTNPDADESPTDSRATNELETSL